MSSAPLVNPSWANSPAWRGIKQIDIDRLDGFLAFMRDPRSFESGTPLSEFTIVQYWSRVRRAMLDGDLTRFLDKPGKNSARATRRQAIAMWALFIGGPEGERLKKKIQGMKDAAKRKGPRGGRAPREDKVALDEDAWRSLRQRAEQDKDAKAVAVQILCRSSLRIGDVLRIAREAVQVGLQTGDLKVVMKGQHTVAFPAAPIRTQLERLLQFRDWDAVQDLLGGTYWSATKQVSRRLKYYAWELGIPGVHPHLLRHCALTYLAHGTGTSTAQALAGHASPVTTAKYTRRPPSTKVLGEAMMRVMGEDEDARKTEDAGSG